ncbi:hypothetical protein MFLAVUS_005415 [Mucor flavus]|uniref:Uncharacterized protein n=1 Tax=Mucor flavus TaxID=439312 RepID=A0ABP9YYP6_9FUNG
MLVSLFYDVRIKSRSRPPVPNTSEKSNAASFQRREISEPIQTCQNKLKDATVELTAVRDVVSGFTSGQGYFAALGVQHKE